MTTDFLIQEVLQTQNPSMEKLIHCCEQIKTNGDVVVIKLDGERIDNPYTVFITIPNGGSIIRVDEKKLELALTNVLILYLEHRSNINF